LRFDRSDRLVYIAVPLADLAQLVERLIRNQ
jgi:hypothetical protein